MNTSGWLQFLLYLAALLAITKPMGLYLMQVLDANGRTWLDPTLKPQGFGPMSPDLAYNPAVSFTTNTNWQAYGGESTLSYLSQMVGLALHNFTSAAVGIVVAIALIRGIVRK